MKIIQGTYDYAKLMVQRGAVPNSVTSLALLLLTVGMVYQITRLNQLEKGSLKQEHVLTRRSAPERRTKTAVASGAIYTRWGRTSCPALSKLVYRGITGGRLYSHTGGGSNILCLPMDPIWANYTDKEEDSAYIYGGEYQINSYHSVSLTGLFSNANSKTLNDHNVPCAVCQTLTPATIMMLPARNTCYSGWKLEYSGYLMAGHFKHVGENEFTCVDVAPEAVPAGHKNENGVLFYPVQAGCGSLPCPPYVQGRELTCSVCSQRHRTHVHKFCFNAEPDY